MCYICAEEGVGMPQLHFYVPEETANKLKARAKAKDKSLSKYIAEIVEKEVKPSGWPEGYFTRVAGSWQGEAIEEPEDFELQERDSLDVFA
jgi:hypothetical protein